MLTAQHSTAQHSLRRRLFASAEEETSEWLYEAYLTDTGDWYGKRCPAIVFDVKQGEQYYIEWSNVRTQNKYIYDMRRCGGMYKVYSPIVGGEFTQDTSGSIDITIQSDGTLYVGCGFNTKFSHGDIGAASFDGDYIRIRKE